MLRGHHFFASTLRATRWAALHPEVAGVLVNQSEAVDLGRRIFGSLLDGDR